MGLAFGVILETWLSCIHNKPKLEVNLTVCFAYLTFYIAELPQIHVSGILAIVFLGIYMTRMGKAQISAESETAVHNVWQQIGFMAECLIFVLSGIMLGYTARTDDIVTFGNFGKSLVLYIFLHIIRLSLLIVVLPCMKSSGYPIQIEHTYLLTWGALRGALGMFLSLILMGNPNVDRRISTIILFHTSFIALMTLVINGNTTGMLVEKFRLAKESSTSKKFMWMFIERVSLHSQLK